MRKEIKMQPATFERYLRNLLGEINAFLEVKEAKRDTKARTAFHIYKTFKDDKNHIFVVRKYDPRKKFEDHQCWEHYLYFLRINKKMILQVLALKLGSISHAGLDAWKEDKFLWYNVESLEHKLGNAKCTLTRTLQPKYLKRMDKYHNANIPATRIYFSQIK